MTKKDRERKQAQRKAHAERRDNRHPHLKRTAEQRRNIKKNHRRKVRRAARKAAA